MLFRTHLLGDVILVLLISPALAQHGAGGSHPPPPPNPPAPLPRPQDSNFDRSRIELNSNGPKPNRAAEADDRCLLPPLTGMREPAVAVKSLQVSAGARKEYAAACDSVQHNRFDPAAEHLRKAVRQAPQYSAAWVTLGQVLVAQQKLPDAKDACTHAVTADANYLVGYLCLADIAGREERWDEMLKFSGRAVELDPSNGAVAYGFQAAANLNLHNLP